MQFLSFPMSPSWKIAAFFSVLLLFPVGAFSQNSLWQVHTSMREVTDLTLASDAAWVATKGGVYRYAFANGEITRYTSIEGLHSVQPKAIAFDAKRKAIWIGYESGVLDRLDTEKGTINAYHDISRAVQFSQKNIGRIVVHGDSILVATEFGLVVFDPIKNEVRDSYTQFGASTKSKVYDVFVDKIPNGDKGFWLATDDGVAYTSLKNKNLREPTAWTIDSSLPAGRSLGKLGGNIIVGTVLDGYSQNNGTWLRQGFYNGEIRRIYSTPSRDQVTIATPFWFVKLSNIGERAQISANNWVSINAAPIANDGSIWIGDGVSGIAQFTNVPKTGVQTLAPAKTVVPNGPQHNLFTDLTTDAKGNLWGVASGELKGGLYKLDASGVWANFTDENVPALKNRMGLDRIFVDKANHVWAGGFRGGVGLIQMDETNKVTVYDKSNSTLTNVANIPDDIRIGGMGMEKDGTLWVTNYLTAPRLHIRTPDGKWTAFNDFNDTAAGTVYGEFNRLFVDSFGQKWVALNAENGVMVMNTKTTPTVQSDDKVRWWNQVGSRDTGLSGGQVRAIAEDRKGGVWLGTSRGLSIFVFGNLATDAQSQPNWPRYDGKLVLRDLLINDMAIDAANRMWIASSEGVWLLNAETYQQLAHFTTENSPLLSNNVSSVTTNNLSGRVYFATDGGLVSYQSNAVAAKNEVQNLLVYPNPAIGTAQSLPKIYIDGLVDNTLIRIVNVSGMTLAQLEARGGRTVWDGKDLQGNLVPSGVYVVVALSKEGEERAFGKVAIVR